MEMHMFVLSVFCVFYYVKERCNWRKLLLIPTHMTVLFVLIFINNARGSSKRSTCIEIEGKEYNAYSSCSKR